MADEKTPGYLDLPFESGSPDPEPLEYADLGEEFRYTGSSEPDAPESEDDGTD